MTLNENLNSEKGETNPFTRVWANKGEPDNEFNKEVQKLAQYQSPVNEPNGGNVKKAKGIAGQLNLKWGLGSILVNLLALVITQTIIVFILGAMGLITADVVSFAANPIVVLLSSLSMYAVWVTGMWLSSKRRGTGNFFKDFNIKFKKRDILYGIGIAFVMYFVTQGAGWLVQTFFNVDLSAADNGSFVTTYSGVWFVIIAYGVASIMGPISEELFFRGYLLSAIQNTFENRNKKLWFFETPENAPRRFKINQWIQKAKTPVAVIVSSIVFGFAHVSSLDLADGSWFLLAATASLGLVLAIVTVKTGRLVPAMIAHMVFNASSITLAVIFGA